jgi:hypothetical protein
MNAYLQKKRSYIEALALVRGPEGIVGRAVWRFRPGDAAYAPLLEVVRTRQGIVPFAEFSELVRLARGRRSSSRRAPHAA